MWIRFTVFVCVVFAVVGNLGEVSRIGKAGLVWVGERVLETVREQARKQNTVTFKDYGNVFSKEDTAKEFLKTHGEFFMTPRQFMLSRYPNWGRLVSHAQAEQSRNKEIKFWLTLSDKYLDTPIRVKVFKTEKEFFQNVMSKDKPGIFGEFQPLELNLCVRLYDLKVNGVSVFILDTLEHEIRHSLQKLRVLRSERAIESKEFVIISNTRSSSVDRFNYLASSAEVCVRLAWIVNDYYQQTGRGISTKGEASRVLEMYGIQVGGSAWNKNAKKVPLDILGLKELIYGIRDLEIQRRLFDTLTEQMPGMA